MGLPSSYIILIMCLCILSHCGKETPSIQGFRVRRCLCTANSGLTTFRTSTMDEVGSACPPVAPQLRAVMREHCHWPRTFWFKPLSPFGLLASHDVYQRFTSVSHVIPPRS